MRCGPRTVTKATPQTSHNEWLLHNKTGLASFPPLLRSFISESTTKIDSAGGSERGFGRVRGLKFHLYVVVVAVVVEDRPQFPTGCCTKSPSVQVNQWSPPDTSQTPGEGGGHVVPRQGDSGGGVGRGAKRCHGGNQGDGCTNTSTWW